LDFTPVDSSKVNLPKLEVTNIISTFQIFYRLQTRHNSREMVKKRLKCQKLHSATLLWPLEIMKYKTAKNSKILLA